MVNKFEIQSLFTVVPSRSTSSEITIICPVSGCGDRSGNRSINLKTGLTGCWRCNKGGHYYNFFKKLGFEVTKDESASSSLSEAEKLMNQVNQDQQITPVLVDIQLPTGFTRVEDAKDSVYYRLIEKMALKKNLEQSDMIQAGVGFTRKDPYWEPFAIFPVMEWGRLVYYQGRAYSPPKGEKKTKQFPSRKQYPFGASYWVYNIDEVRQTEADTVIVVESILNVLSLKKRIAKLGWKNVVPVCVFKHKVSKPQITKILACRSVKEVNLLFDADATKLAWESAAELTNRRKITVTEMPGTPDNPRQDPNDNVDLALKMFERRKSYTPTSGLLQELNSL